MSVEPARRWDYQRVPSRPAHSIAAYAGRALGGSSAINGNIARRAWPIDFACWQVHGLPGWEWAQVLADYKAWAAGSRPRGLAPGTRTRRPHAGRKADLGEMRVSTR